MILYDLIQDTAKVAFLRISSVKPELPEEIITVKITLRPLMNGENKLCELTKTWEQCMFDGFRTGVEE